MQVTEIIDEIFFLTTGIHRAIIGHVQNERRNENR